MNAAPAENESGIIRARQCHGEARTVLVAMVQADERIVEKSATVLGKLVAIEDCSDPQRWMESAGLPRDPDARARALELETQYLQAKLSHEIGRIARAKQLLHACIEDAEDIGFRQLQARSHIDLAQLEADFFSHTLATQHAVRAMELAESSGDDALAAFVAIQQVWVLAYQLGRADQADALIAHARAHVERSPSQTELRETLLHTLNAVYGSSGRLRDAESSARELIELLEARGESLSPDLLLAQKNLGVTLTRLSGSV